MLKYRAGRSRRTGDIGNGIAAVAAEAERIAASAAAMMMIHGKTPFHGIPFGNALLRSLYFTHALRQVCAKQKRRETVKIAGKRRGRKEKVFCGLNDGEKDEKAALWLWKKKRKQRLQPLKKTKKAACNAAGRRKGSI